MRKLLMLVVVAASLLIIMSTFALAQVYLPGPGIYLSITPSVKTVAPGTWVTFYVTAYDIDAYGDPQDVEDSLTFTITGEWDGPTPSKLAPDRPYEAMHSIKYEEGQHEFTITANDTGQCADDPAVSVTVRIAVGDVMPDGVICVSPDGNDSNCGLNWTYPKKTIQAAVDAAQPNGEIWVKAGDYSAYCIVINKDLKLYGGFVGNETQRNPRDLKNNVTSITSTPTPPPTPPAVMYVSSPTDSYGQPIGSYINFTLDGFTFKDCVQCRGLSVSFATANIMNNVFKNNKGAIYIRQCTNTNLTGNMIVDNHAQIGGGVYLGGGGTYTDLAINNNTIVNNTATVDCGGIYAEMPVSGAVKNNIIAFNTGGGIKKESSPMMSLSLSKNCVYGNIPDNYLGVSHPTDIDLPPLLTADYHLASDSPCIDAGDDSVVQTGAVDIDGETRINGIHVDIGSDEYYPDTTPPNPGTATAPPTTITSAISVNYTDASDPGTISSGLKKVELWYKKGVLGTWTNSGQTIDFQLMS